MITTLLILHGLMAMALAGAVTHQAIAVCWPNQRPNLRGMQPADGGHDLVGRLRSVTGPAYTTAVIVLFIATFVLGSIIYPAYRVGVRNYLQSYRLLTPEGAFEIKEHAVSIALALLPFYWWLWQGRQQAPLRARKIVTALLAAIVWYAFLVGHVLNNIRGLYGA